MSALTKTEARHLAGAVVVETLSRHWPRALRDIRVDWNGRLTSTAGRAFLRQARIELSAKILPVAGEAAVRRTTIHELAHLRAWTLHGERGHGDVWRSIMLQFGAEPNRCHEYFQVPRVAKALGRKAIRCTRCYQTWPVSKVQARNRKRGQYMHRGCGGLITVLEGALLQEWFASEAKALNVDGRAV